MPADDCKGAPTVQTPLPASVPAASPPAASRPRLSDLARLFHGSQDMGSLAVAGLFVLALVAFLRFAEAIVLPVVLAVLFYFLLKPAVMALQRLHIPRPLGAVLILAVVIGAFVTALSTLQDPAREFLTKAPESVRKLEGKVREILRRVEQLTRSQTGENAEVNNDTPPTKGFDLSEKVLSYGTLIYTASFLTGFLETIVLLYFLLAAGDRFLETVVGALPGQSGKDEAVAIVNDVQHSISRYLVTVAGINSCVGLIVAAAMLVLGMPNPVLWGVVAAILNFMPYFGPLTVFSVLVLAGLLSFESVGQALLPAAVYACVHAVESNLVTPSILGRRLTLNPLIIFLALMFWTWLWGIAGALLSVPLLMMFKILCDHTPTLAPIGELLAGRTPSAAAMPR
jgi:predicted PurR-regulated permease PerM